MGPAALAASIVNTIIGAGIFAAPGKLSASVGAYAPVAFLVCAVAVGSVAICFAEGGSRVPTSGGAYGYIEAAFGPLAGYVAGTLLWFSDALGCGGIAAALADTAVTLLPSSARSAAHATVIVVVLGGIALVNVGGVQRGARLVYAGTALKLVPLAIFLVVGVVAIHPAYLVTTYATAKDPGRALILALFAFSGMEAPLSASGEVSQPARTIPRALAISMLSVTALYVAIQLVAEGILGPALAQSSTPLADAMASLNPALRLVMLGGAGVSMLAWMGSDILGTPRMVFALARDGLLPAVLGRVHPRTHAPHVAILAYAALTAVLALTGTFTELAILSTLALAPLYIAACAASVRLARRGVARAGQPLAFRGLTAAAVVGTASMVGVVALASAGERLALLAVVSASAVLYFVQTRRSPWHHAGP
jgi:amino acid transporter